MPRFELFKDTKYTIWYRTKYSIDAETLEDAITKAIHEDDSGDGDYLYDTLEDMRIEENDGVQTVEIYNADDRYYDDTDLVWDNLNGFKT